MLDNLLLGLQSTFSLVPLIIILIGSFIGLIFGAIPGLGPTVAATLLISFTYTMNPMHSILFDCERLCRGNIRRISNSDFI